MLRKSVVTKSSEESVSMKPAKEPTLFAREKLLISLLYTLQKPIADIDFQMLLFLYCTLCYRDYEKRATASIYQFVPYKNRACSFTSHHDRKRLITRNVLEASVAEWKLTSFGKKLANGSRSEDTHNFIKKYGALKAEELIDKSFQVAPLTAKESEVLRRALMYDSLTKEHRVHDTQSTLSNTCLFTIGYQQRSQEGFFKLLLKNSIAVLIDVRRNPISRRYGFSKSALQEACSKLDIQYEHLPQLGIAKHERSDLNNEQSYRKLFEDYKNNVIPNQEQSVEILLAKLSSDKRIALTCFERGPEQCHRSVLADWIMNLTRQPSCTSYREWISTVRLKHL